MNNVNSSHCYAGVDYGGAHRYNIPLDSFGNNIVTGEGSQQKNYKKNFTCVDLEIYSVLYNTHPFKWKW